jgi:hypothetical protein
LPVETRLPGFTGNVGILSSDPPTVTPASVRVGDPVQLTVIVRSDGDLMRLIPPEPPRDRQWQVFPATPAGFVGATPNANPGAVFHYTLIPVTDDAGATPAMPFSYFDPGRAEYVDLTIPPVTVNVQPGELPVQAPLDWPELDEREKPPALSGLATAEGRKVSSLTPLQLRLWFPAMQLLPALGFLGLLIWDQRRRHLEQHPEIVRRRAARRALRRQRRLLKRAAAAGDAPGFARHSVTAMQVACAPHYPAEPRALVCGDVLSLIGPAEGNGKSAEVVRCFFAAVNDSRFAASPRDHVEVFALKSELDDVLKRLEARL